MKPGMSAVALGLILLAVDPDVASTWERFTLRSTSPTFAFGANPDTTGTITLRVIDRSGATSTGTGLFP